MLTKLRTIIDGCRRRSSLFDRLCLWYTDYRLPWGMTPHQVVYRTASNPLLLPLYLKNFVSRHVLGRGVDVIDRDWDTLVILDSCTYDLFEDCSDLPGTLSKVVSPGGATGEFLFSTLPDADLRDTVYVTASPGVRFVEDHRNVSLHAIDDVWKDRWDEAAGTVLPETMAERARLANERYPDKRLVVHFMQPHFPFVGPTGQSIDHREYGGQIESSNTDAESIWSLLEQGAVSEKTVRTAYRENLELALPHVADLLDVLDGKTVVTSDHGNAFGEWGVYGHTPGAFLDEVVHVPWLEVPFDSRRTIRKAESDVSEEDLQDVSDRLEDLGYGDGATQF